MIISLLSSCQSRHLHVRAPPSFAAHRLDRWIIQQPSAETTLRHGNEGADNAGRLAVVQFESFNGSCTPEAKVLKPALSPPALETSAGRSSGAESHELKLTLTHPVSKHTALSLMEESAQPPLSPLWLTLA